MFANIQQKFLVGNPLRSCSAVWLAWPKPKFLHGLRYNSQAYMLECDLQHELEMSHTIYYIVFGG